MKPPIWQVHDWLQTESAYPNGPLHAATCHLETAAKLALGNQQPVLALVIGPATYHELELFQQLVKPFNLRAITCFEREVAAIRDQGFDVLVADMHDQPWSENVFDLVYSSNVLEHAFSPYGALLELRRVLKPGGKLYSVIPTFETDGGGNTPWHVHCMSKAEWAELHHKTGFKLVLQREVHEPSVPASYYHFCASAVEPPAPHDEALRKLIALKGAKP